MKSVLNFKVVLVGSILMGSLAAYSRARSQDDSATCKYIDHPTNGHTSEVVVHYTGFSKEMFASLTSNGKEELTGNSNGGYRAETDLSDLKKDSNSIAMLQALNVDTDKMETSANFDFKLVQKDGALIDGSLTKFLDIKGTPVGSIMVLEGFPFACIKTTPAKPAIEPIPTLVDKKAYLEICDPRRAGCINRIVVNKNAYVISYDKTADKDGSISSYIRNLIDLAKDKKTTKSSTFAVKGYVSKEAGHYPNPAVEFTVFKILSISK